MLEQRSDGTEEFWEGSSSSGQSGQEGVRVDSGTVVWSGHGRDKAAVQASCPQVGMDKRHFKGNDDDSGSEDEGKGGVWDDWDRGGSA